MAKALLVAILLSVAFIASTAGAPPTALGAPPEKLGAGAAEVAAANGGEEKEGGRSADRAGRGGGGDGVGGSVDTRSSKPTTTRVIGKVMKRRLDRLQKRGVVLAAQGIPLAQLSLTHDSILNTRLETEAPSKTYSSSAVDDFIFVSSV